MAERRFAAGGQRVGEAAGAGEYLAVFVHQADERGGRPGHPSRQPGEAVERVVGRRNEQAGTAQGGDALGIAERVGEVLLEGQGQCSDGAEMWGSGLPEMSRATESPARVVPCRWRAPRAGPTLEHAVPR
jgi:hypothetical protein